MNLFRVSEDSEVISVVGFNLRATAPLFLGVCMLMPLAAQAQITEPATGTVQGTVLIASENDPIIVSGARIVVYGEAKATSTVSDREGKFTFSQLAPGVYFLEATYLGLHAVQNMTIEAGEVVHVVLQLKAPIQCELISEHSGLGQASAQERSMKCLLVIQRTETKSTVRK